MSKHLKSNNLEFELVQEKDAKFILELRSNENLNKYLSKSVITEEEQKKWIQKYKKRENAKIEFYFKISEIDGEEFGFIRIYNIDYKKKHFTWGSWIMKENKPIYSPLESVLLLYMYAFKRLKLEKAFFDVRKDNLNVVKFHEKFGATKISKDNLNYYFEFSKEKFDEIILKKYKKYLLEI